MAANKLFQERKKHLDNIIYFAFLFPQGGDFLNLYDYYITGF